MGMVGIGWVKRRIIYLWEWGRCYKVFTNGKMPSSMATKEFFSLPLGWSYS